MLIPRITKETKTKDLHPKPVPRTTAGYVWQLKMYEAGAGVSALLFYFSITAHDKSKLCEVFIFKSFKSFLITEGVWPTYDQS